MTETKNGGLRKYLITDKSFYKKALLIMLPVLLQSCINQGVNMMDTIMVGKLGEAAISASSLANQFYTIFNIMCLGLSAAGLVLASQYYGAGDMKTVRRVFDLILQMAIILGTAFAAVTALIPEKIMSIYTNEQDVIELGAGYLRITALIFLPHGTSFVMSNILRSIGNAKLGLYISILSFVVNIFCNYAFIFGKFGAPCLGVTGAAVGTLCARSAEFIVCIVYIFKFEKTLCYKLSGLIKLPKVKLLSEFRRLGLPAVISDTLLALAASVISMILGHMGKEVVSAYAIVTVLERLCTIAIGAVSSASGVIVGQSIGEGEFERAMKEGCSFHLISIGTGLIASLLVLFLGVWSIGLYDITEATIEIAKVMMYASAINVFFQCTQNSLTKGILRGGGDTKFLMVADIIFQWCASIPLGYLCGLVFKISPFFVLLALRIDYPIKAVWLTGRLFSGKWIHQAKKMS